MLLWFALCSISWLTSVQRQKQVAQAEFERILNHKVNFLGLIGEKQSSFINDERTIRLAEIVSHPFLSRLRSILATSDTLAPTDFPQLPMIGATGLFVSRKGRLTYHSGQNFEEYFGKDWARLLFLSMRTGGDLFVQRAKSLYSFPITYEEFLATANRFQMIFKKGNFLLRWYFSMGDWNVLYVVHLDPLQPENLKQEAMQMFIGGHKNLSLGFEDAFIWGQAKKVYSEVSPGIVYTRQPETFYEHLSIRPHLILCLLLPGIWLYRKGGYLILATRFEFRYLLYTSLPILTSMILLWIWLEPYHLDHQGYLRSQTVLNISSVLKQNIDDYVNHLSSLNQTTTNLPVYRCRLDNDQAHFENVNDSVLKVLLLSVLGSNRHDKTPVAPLARNLARNLSRGSHNYRKMVDQALNNPFAKDLILVSWQEDTLFCSSRTLSLQPVQAESFCYSQKDIANQWFESQLPTVLKQMKSQNMDIKSLMMVFDAASRPPEEFAQNEIPQYEVENLINLHGVRESLWLEWNYLGLWLSTLWGFEFPSDRKFLVLSSVQNIHNQHNIYLRTPMLLMFLALVFVVWQLLQFKSALLLVLKNLKEMVLDLKFYKSEELKKDTNFKNSLTQKLLVLRHTILEKLKALPYLSPASQTYLSQGSHSIPKKMEQSVSVHIQFISQDLNFDPRPHLKKICERYPLLYSEDICLKFVMSIPDSLSSRPQIDSFLAVLDLAHLLPENVKMLCGIFTQETTFVCLGDNLYRTPSLIAKNTLENIEKPIAPNIKYKILMDSEIQFRVQYLHEIKAHSDSLFVAEG